jgi:hypothetical protein
MLLVKYRTALDSRHRLCIRRRCYSNSDGAPVAGGSLGDTTTAATICKVNLKRFLQEKEDRQV